MAKKLTPAEKGALTKKKNAAAKKKSSDAAKKGASKQSSTVVSKGQPRPMNLHKHGVEK